MINFGKSEENNRKNKFFAINIFLFSLRFGRAEFLKPISLKLNNEGWIYVKRTITETLLDTQCGLKPGNGAIPSIANCFKDESVKNFFSHHEDNYCLQNSDLERPRAVICG